MSSTAVARTPRDVLADLRSITAGQQPDVPIDMTAGTVDALVDSLEVLIETVDRYKEIEKS